jgi:hypothetical protein
MTCGICKENTPAPAAAAAGCTAAICRGSRRATTYRIGHQADIMAHCDGPR